MHVFLAFKAQLCGYKMQMLQKTEGRRVGPVHVAGSAPTAPELPLQFKGKGPLQAAGVTVGPYFPLGSI